MTIMMPRANMMSVIRRLGLTQGLKLCLDAGDEASYSGSGQTWSDVSGNGHHFYRGATSGSESSDPAYNGTAGRRSAGEYFGFDGGDYCVLAASNPTWANNMHKDNAKWAAIAAVYLANLDGNQGIFGTQAGAHQIGSSVYIDTAGKLNWLIGNGSTEETKTSSGALSAGAWALIGMSVDEAKGAGGLIFNINGTSSTHDATIASPSASNASTMEVASLVGGTIPIRNGGRLGFLCMWESVALNAGALNALFQAARGKFGA